MLRMNYVWTLVDCISQPTCLDFFLMLRDSCGYPSNQKEPDMQAPAYPITPLRQIAIILAHCVLRIQKNDKRLIAFSPA
jgi:hypothetical protein